jgi:hypothetical protein
MFLNHFFVEDLFILAMMNWNLESIQPNFIFFHFLILAIKLTHFVT